ncbi:MAG: ATP-binding protein, partial [Tuberibacillus sp.]
IMIENADLLSQKVLEDENNSLSFVHDDAQKSFLESFFASMGEALNIETGAVSDHLNNWISWNRDKYLTEINQSSILFPGYRVINTIILDFVEEQIKGEVITPAEMMRDLKKINEYLQCASSYFLLHSHANIGDDEKITVQELAELKYALKEAAILTVMDKNDRIKYANKKFCEVTQYNIEEIIGKSHYDLVYSGYHPHSFCDEIMAAIKEGRVWNGEICNKAKDGSLYWVDTTIVPFRNRKGETYQHMSIQHDITQKKQAEAMLLKMEKLSLVGELAAGFAHEIRNPLTTIKGFVQLLFDPYKDKQSDYAKTILDEIDRINYIVSEFMVLAKPHAEQFTKCGVNAMINNVIHFLQAEANLKNVVISPPLKLGEFYVYGEKHQLTQVFINIVKNALDALPNGGEIKFSYILHDREITISVEDNGMGMTEEQVKRIGEPFYTTKENGNGLGLMVSYRIIHNHKGRIKVFSEPGRGTTFLVPFPLWKEND